VGNLLVVSVEVVDVDVAVVLFEEGVLA